MTKVTDWDKYPNFSEREFKCSHTGLCEMQEEFMDILQTIRTVYGKPMTVSSGYRHPTHPVEARKERAGGHSQGMCADISVMGENALELLTVALKCGITRVGIQQKGSGRFLHLGIEVADHFPTPHIWSY